LQKASAERHFPHAERQKASAERHLSHAARRAADKG